MFNDKGIEYIFIIICRLDKFEQILYVCTVQKTKYDGENEHMKNAIPNTCELWKTHTFSVLKEEVKK